MAEMQSFDGKRWQPAIPMPFWYKGWRTFWRWRPACYPCGCRLFKNEAEYEKHYRNSHLGATSGL